MVVYDANTQMVLWLGDCGMMVTWPDLINFASPRPARLIDISVPVNEANSVAGMYSIMDGDLSISSNGTIFWWYYQTTFDGVYHESQPSRYYARLPV